MSTELLPGFDTAGVLLSIRPAFAKLIVSGAKTVELRRRFPDLPSGTALVLYATKPLAELLGIARLSATTSATLPVLWRKFGSASAVTKQTFDLYFGECTRGLAIEFGEFASFAPPINLTELRTIWPAFSPPQSYRYVPDEILKKLCTRPSAPTSSSANVVQSPHSGARR